MWFQLVSVELGNASQCYPAGDACGVTVCWHPPTVFEGLDVRILGAIFERIRSGPGAGEDYRPSRQAKQNWVGHAIQECAAKTADQTAKIVKQWIENGVLIIEDFVNPRTRRAAERVVLDERKAAAILAPLQAHSLSLWEPHKEPRTNIAEPRM
jgi:hypothetical protein